MWPASVAFRAVVCLRRAAYRLRILSSHRASVPVIVVGNIVAGGSGKTPLVLWIAEFLKRKGWNPAIVSRGYGVKIDAPRAATILSEAVEVGDEPALLARRSGCPVWVGPDRVRVIEALQAGNPEVDVVILDDGLQHYRLRRDIEIAVVDARGFGNGFMLPAGPLREPPSRLRSVDAVVAHGVDAPGFRMSLKGTLLRRLADSSDRRELAAFKGQKMHAVAGIGDPRRFFLLLGRAGIEVIPHAFPDHHPLKPEELAFGDGRAVVMTEKDAVKLRGVPAGDWWVLPVHVDIDPAFGEWLLGRLAALGNKRRE
ncbi:MAG: tetraacyldisaccharide 4'-kinase [Burkholderiales bacterium]